MTTNLRGNLIMRIIHSLLWGFIITWFSLPVFAELQITLQPDTKKVVISNDIMVSNVDVYLIQFDLDAKDEQFSSWQLKSGKWDSGLKPVSSKSLDLPVLESYRVEFENKLCPENHRCFLAAVATSPNQTAAKFWQASSFLPLSLEAACERFQGQQFFVSCDGGGLRDEVEDGAVAMVEPSPAPTAPANKESTTNADTTAGSGASETEKPDIFKLIDNKLLFANSQAKRFQVIDVADFENPRMSGWTALAANPREIYALNDHYILLQTSYGVENGANLTVFNEDEFGNPNSVYSMALPGRFIESRRRGEHIYIVTEQYTTKLEIYDCLDCKISGRISGSTININALRLDATGKLQEVDKAQLAGYSPTVAIFPNHLVIANHNPEESNWRSTQIQLFDLSQADPLVALPILNVPGRVPSEFHLSVYDQQFRVVYGPENREAGSTLAIYDLTKPKMPLLGQVAKIAPGEDLFATRFVNNRAFVVTYERTDPLWVIDLSEPTKPTIVGELHIPGWSEKMFFHEDRLFAVGMDDQPTEDEKWARRVAVSLFDVKDPTNPLLINRFTPLVGEATYSWSPALDDERALLLNWNDAFAALPINSWETKAGSNLQIVSFANDRIEDAGLLNSPVQIQRSLSLAPNILAALADQALMTLRWGGTEPEILGELELAFNINWLQLQNEKLWAAGYGNNGYHRFYRYTMNDIETPAERWRLPRGYNGLQMDKNLAVFYDYNPLAVQVLDTRTGKLHPAEQLEKTDEGAFEETSNSMVASTTSYVGPHWYSGHPLVHNGWFHVAEQRQFQNMVNKPAFMRVPENDYWQPQWVLRSWDLTVTETKEAESRQIPGRPLAFTANGELITQEYTRDWQYRLNLLALGDNQARLLQSRVVPCEGSSQFMLANDAVYISCHSGGNRYGPVFDKDIAYEEKGDGDSVRADEATVASEDKPTTQILKLNPGQGFTEDESWTLPGYQNLRAVAGETALVAPNGWWYYGGVDDANVEGMPPYQSGCNVYQLVAGIDPKFLSNLEDCPYVNEGWALTPKKAWMPKGFEGISVIEW